MFVNYRKACKEVNKIHLTHETNRGSVLQIALNIVNKG